MNSRKTISFDRDQKLVKAFHWAWGSYPTDTCKLAWGIIFIWLGAIFNAVDATVGEGLRMLSAWWRVRHPKKRKTSIYDLPLDEYVAARKELKLAEEARKARRRERLAWLINSVEWFSDHIYQPTKRFFERTERVWDVVGQVFFGLLLAVAVIFLVIFVINFPLTALGVVVVIALLLGAYWLIDRNENSIKRFFKRVGQVLGAAYHSFHNRTCAIVRIEADEDERQPVSEYHPA